MVLDFPPGYSQGLSSPQPNSPSSGEPSLIPLTTAGSCNSRDLPSDRFPWGRAESCPVDLRERLWGRCLLLQPRTPGCGMAGKYKCCRGIWPQPQSSLFSCSVHGGIKKGVGVGQLLQGDALTPEHTACLYIRSENVPKKHLIPLCSFLAVLNSDIYIYNL